MQFFIHIFRGLKPTKGFQLPLTHLGVFPPCKYNFFFYKQNTESTGYVSGEAKGKEKNNPITRAHRYNKFTAVIKLPFIRLGTSRSCLMSAKTIFLFWAYIHYAVCQIYHTFSGIVHTQKQFDSWIQEQDTYGYFICAEGPSKCMTFHQRKR